MTLFWIVKTLSCYESFLIKPTVMEERERIIVVLVAVGIFNLLDRFLIHPHKGLTDFAVFGSIIIALILYLILIFFFGKKHLN